jgi:Zn-finger nucleic acid-binding protein
MRKVAKDNVLIDRCPECGGVWLDAGELEMIERGAGHGKAEILQQAREELLDDAKNIVSVIGLCPKCQTTQLQPIKKRKVELDYCQRCEGMFFDESELEMVVGGRPGTLFEAIIVLIRR